MKLRERTIPDLLEQFDLDIKLAANARSGGAAKAR